MDIKEFWTQSFLTVLSTGVPPSMAKQFADESEALYLSKYPEEIKKQLDSINPSILDLHIDVLELRTRGMTHLLHKGIESVSDLVRCSQQEIRRIVGLGHLTFREIKDVLRHYSLYLGMTEEDILQYREANKDDDKWKGYQIHKHDKESLNTSTLGETK